MDKTIDSREVSKAQSDVEEIASIVIDSAFQLHKDLCPGLLEGDK